MSAWVLSRAFGCGRKKSSIGCRLTHEGHESMLWRRNLAWLTIAAVTAPAAFGQAAPPATIPDLSGVWAHPSIPGFEPLASGPTSLKNLSRRGVTGDNRQLVGDYANPIL